MLGSGPRIVDESDNLTKPSGYMALVKCLAIQSTLWVIEVDQTHGEILIVSRTCTICSGITLGSCCKEWITDMESVKRVFLQLSVYLNLTVKIRIKSA